MNITIPIVMLASYDPVATGIIDSLPRPGGNFTGLTILDREISGKRLQLLQETNARTSRVGVLWNAETPGPYQAFKEYEAAARVLKVQLQSLEVRSPADLKRSLKMQRESGSTRSSRREIPFWIDTKIASPSLV